MSLFHFLLSIARSPLRILGLCGLFLASVCPSLAQPTGIWRVAIEPRPPGSEADYFYAATGYLSYAGDGSFTVPAGGWLELPYRFYAYLDDANQTYLNKPAYLEIWGPGGAKVTYIATHGGIIKRPTHDFMLYGDPFGPDNWGIVPQLESPTITASGGTVRSGTLRFTGLPAGNYTFYYREGVVSGTGANASMWVNLISPLPPSDPPRGSLSWYATGTTIALPIVGGNAQAEYFQDYALGFSITAVPENPLTRATFRITNTNIATYFPLLNPNSSRLTADPGTSSYVLTTPRTWSPGTTSATGAVQPLRAVQLGVFSGSGTGFTDSTNSIENTGQFIADPPNLSIVQARTNVTITLPSSPAQAALNVDYTGISAIVRRTHDNVNLTSSGATVSWSVVSPQPAGYASGTINSGSGTLRVSAVGTQPYIRVAATYAGDTNHQSSSSFVDVPVAPPFTGTLTFLNTSNAPITTIFYMQPFRIGYNVTAPASSTISSVLIGLRNGPDNNLSPSTATAPTPFVWDAASTSFQGTISGLANPTASGTITDLVANAPGSITFAGSSATTSVSSVGTLSGTALTVQAAPTTTQVTGPSGPLAVGIDYTYTATLRRTHDNTVISGANFQWAVESINGSAGVIVSPGVMRLTARGTTNQVRIRATWLGDARHASSTGERIPSVNNPITNGSLRFADGSNSALLPQDAAGDYQIEYMRPYSIRYGATRGLVNLSTLDLRLANGSSSTNPSSSLFNLDSGSWLRTITGLPTTATVSGVVSTFVANTAGPSGIVVATGVVRDVIGDTLTLGPARLDIVPAATTMALTSGIASQNQAYNGIGVTLTRVHSSTDVTPARSSLTWTIDNTGSETAIGTIDANGTLTVTDVGNGFIRVRARWLGDIYHAPAEQTVRVAVNRGATLAISSPSKIRSGDSASLSFSATDEDNNLNHLIVRYRTTGSTQWYSIKPSGGSVITAATTGAANTDAADAFVSSAGGSGTLNTNTFAWVPGMAGRYEIWFRAIDIMGAVAESTRTLDVVAPPSVSLQVTSVTAANGGPTSGVRHTGTAPLAANSAPNLLLNAGDSIQVSVGATGRYAREAQLGQFPDLIGGSAETVILNQATTSQTDATGTVSTSGTWTVPGSGSAFHLIAGGYSDATGSFTRFNGINGIPGDSLIASSTPGNYRIAIQVNSRPVASVPAGGPTSLYVGESGSYTYAATDANGNMTGLHAEVTPPSSAGTSTSLTVGNPSTAAAANSTLFGSAGTWTLRTRARDALDPAAGGTLSTALSVTVADRPPMWQWLEYRKGAAARISATSTLPAGYANSASAIYTTTARGSIGSGLGGQTFYVGDVVDLRAFNARSYSAALQAGTLTDIQSITMQIVDPAGTTTTIATGETVTSVSSRYRDHALSLTRLGTYTIRIWGTAASASGAYVGDNSSAPVVYSLVVTNTPPTGTLSILNGSGIAMIPNGSNRVSFQFGQPFSLRYELADVDGNLNALAITLNTTGDSTTTPGGGWIWNAGSSRFTRSFTYSPAVGSRTEPVAGMTATRVGDWTLDATASDASAGNTAINVPNITVIRADTAVTITNTGRAVQGLNYSLTAAVDRVHDGFDLPTTGVTWSVSNTASETGNGTFTTGSGGSAVLVVNNRGNGRIRVVATYPGDTNHNSSSNAVVVAINQPPTLALSILNGAGTVMVPNGSNRVSFQFGQPFSLRYQLTAVDSNLTGLALTLNTTGDSTTNPGGWTWNAGTSRFTRSFSYSPAVASRTEPVAGMTATRVGDWTLDGIASDAAGDSASISVPNVTVIRADSAVTITNTGRAVQGQNYSLSAAVDRVHDGFDLSPASVTWTVDNSASETGTGTFTTGVGGSAVFVVSSRGNGLVRVRASYPGDTNHNPSTNVAVVQINRPPTLTLAVLNSAGTVLTPDASNRVQIRFGQTFQLRYSILDADSNLTSLALNLNTSNGDSTTNPGGWTWVSPGFTRSFSYSNLGSRVETVTAQTATRVGVWTINATATDALSESMTASNPTIEIVRDDLTLTISNTGLAVQGQNYPVTVTATRTGGAAVSTATVSWSTVASAAETGVGTLAPATGSNSNLLVSARGNGLIRVRASYPADTNYNAVSVERVININRPPSASLVIQTNGGTAAPLVSNVATFEYMERFGLRYSLTDADSNLRTFAVTLGTGSGSSSNPETAGWTWDAGTSTFRRSQTYTGVVVAQTPTFTGQTATFVGDWTLSATTTDEYSESVTISSPNIRVRRADTSTTITSSTRAIRNVPYTLQATVTRTHDSVALVSPSLTFSIANTGAETAQGTISGSTLTITDAGNGLIRIAASFAGDTNHNGSTSATIVLPVNRPPTISVGLHRGTSTTDVLASGSPMLIASYGTQYGVRITVTDPDGDAPTISGYVLKRQISGTDARSAEPAGTGFNLSTTHTWSDALQGYTQNATVAFVADGGGFSWSGTRFSSSGGPAGWNPRFSISDGFETVASGTGYSWITGNLDPAFTSLAFGNGTMNFALAATDTSFTGPVVFDNMSCSVGYRDSESQASSLSFVLTPPNGTQLTISPPNPTQWTWNSTLGAYTRTMTVPPVWATAMSSWATGVRFSRAGNWTAAITINDLYGGRVTRTITIAVDRITTGMNFSQTSVFREDDSPPIALGDTGALNAVLTNVSGYANPTGSIVYSLALDTPFGTPGTIVGPATMMESARAYRLLAEYGGDEFYKPVSVAAALTLTADVLINVRAIANPDGRYQLFFTPSEEEDVNVPFRRP